MTREEEIAKLDLNQAKANFEIETDPGRHDEPPVMDFDRLGICKHCRVSQINYPGYKVTITCPFMGMYARDVRKAEFCEDNARVTEYMEKYYE